MADRLQEFRNKVDDGVRLWTALFVNPYCDAYLAAFDDFKRTLSEQAEADKRNAELCVLAASVVTGSLLMAAVGSASMRALAGRAALRMISSANLRLTYRAAQALGSNAVATFAIGKFLDEAKSSVKREAEDGVAKMIASAPNQLTTAPLSLKMQMESILAIQAVCATDTARVVEDSRTLSEAEKTAHFALLEKAPIAMRPTGAVHSAGLAKKIELSMLMSYVLDLDTLIDVQARVVGGGPYTGFGDGLVNRERAKSIDIRPSDPSYPRPGVPRMQGNLIPAHQRIGISQAGSKIVSKTNELHQAVLGSPFFTHTQFWESSTSPAELRKAEDTLNDLGRRSRPTLAHGIQV